MHISEILTFVSQIGIKNIQECAQGLHSTQGRWFSPPMQLFEYFPTFAARFEKVIELLKVCGTYSLERFERFASLDYSH